MGETSTMISGVVANRILGPLPRTREFASMTRVTLSIMSQPRSLPFAAVVMNSLAGKAAIVAVRGTRAFRTIPCRCRSAFQGRRRLPNTLHCHGFRTPLRTSPHWHAFGSATRIPGNSKIRSASYSA